MKFNPRRTLRRPSERRVRTVQQYAKRSNTAINLDVHQFELHQDNSRKYLEDTIHGALGPSLAFGQCLGLLPVAGILGGNYFNLRFTWASWRFYYALLITAGGATLMSLAVYSFLLTGLNISTFGMLTFYVTVFCALVLFLQLASQWRDVINTVASGEVYGAFIVHSRGRWSLRRKLCLCSFFLLSGAAIEHGLYIFSKLSPVYKYSDRHTIIQHYFTESFPMIFDFTEYAPWKAVLIQIWNIQATMIWNFQDLFITLIAIGLADHFEKLNDYLITSKEKHSLEMFWYSVRMQYLALSNAVKKMDRAVNKIIFLSFITNFYVICQQIFNTLNTVMNKEFTFDSIHFFLSFSILLVRFLAACLAAAHVHTAAKKPMILLHSLSSQHYYIEVQRFLKQVSSDNVALTGLNLISITRAVILKIAAAVVSYELVLLQFKTPNAAQTPAIMKTVSNSTF